MSAAINARHSGGIRVVGGSFPPRFLRSRAFGSPAAFLRASRIRSAWRRISRALSMGADAHTCSSPVTAFLSPPLPCAPSDRFGFLVRVSIGISSLPCSVAGAASRAGAVDMPPPWPPVRALDERRLLVSPLGKLREPFPRRRDARADQRPACRLLLLPHPGEDGHPAFRRTRRDAPPGLDPRRTRLQRRRRRRRPVRSFARPGRLRRVRPADSVAARPSDRAGRLVRADCPLHLRGGPQLARVRRPGSLLRGRRPALGRLAPLGYGFHSPSIGGTSRQRLRRATSRTVSRLTL